MDVYLGLNVRSVGKFRIDIRRCLVQVYDTLTGTGEWNLGNFRDINGNFISQRVDSLKAISQLSFRYNNYVFEIEIPNAGAVNKVAILVTNLDTYDARLLNEDEYVLDTGNTWSGLFDKYGELIGMGALQIPYIDLARLCSLSKDIIIISNLFYIRSGYSADELIEELADIIKLVAHNDEFIATKRNDHYTYQDIVDWLSNGRPII